MFCSSDAAVDIDPDVRRMKEGDFLKFQKGFFSSRWRKWHGVLFSDSRLAWYEEKGDRKPKGSVLLKDVIPYICVGMMTDRMPVKRPSVPDGSSVHHLVGIGMDPKAEIVHWILFASDADIEGWFAEITKTLPTPQPQAQQQPGPAQSSPQQLEIPPQAPPTTPQQGPYPGQQQPPPQYNSTHPPPNQSTHTTVVVNTNNNNGYDDGGFATGLLAGSLMGYGMGSMWGGHGMMMGGPMFCPPMMGGAFTSDNDTNVVNNYYNGVPENIAADPQEAQESQPEPEEDADNGGYDDGAGYGEDYGDGMNYGGDDYGGGGFGGGDYGGGDFGGGDFGGGDF